MTAGKPSPAPNYHLPQINQPAQRSPGEAGAKSGASRFARSMCGGDIPTPGSYYFHVWRGHPHAGIVLLCIRR